MILQEAGLRDTQNELTAAGRAAPAHMRLTPCPASGRSQGTPPARDRTFPYSAKFKTFATVQAR